MQPCKLKNKGLKNKFVFPVESWIFIIHKRKFTHGSI
jgi:hypothetical protein